MIHDPKCPLNDAGLKAWTYVCVAVFSCEVCSETEEQDSAVQQGQQSVWVAPWPRVGGIT